MSSPIRLTASQWIQKHRRGEAAMVDGRRHVIAHQQASDEPVLVEVAVENPDARCTLEDRRLDPEDLARVFTGFGGQPISLAPTMRYVRSSGSAHAYVFDEDSGMVYILD